MTAPGEDGLAQAFRLACLSELESLKPGNVHIFADGHGMVVQDFVRSAEAAAKVIAHSGMSVGQRILAAVEATRGAVGCNTNLGIVLLSAPLLHAMQHAEGATLRDRLKAVLRSLTIEDARLTSRAILCAMPAGLGASEAHDVHGVATVSLLEMMRAAQHRDRIAWQYAHDFADIFEFAVPRYREMFCRWGWSAWAATAVHLGLMARECDTHILRKHGRAVAQAVRDDAKICEAQLMAMENPKKGQRMLLDFDTRLKASGLNPGTSADLTVATLLVVALEGMAAENMVTEIARS